MAHHPGSIFSCKRIIQNNNARFLNTRKRIQNFGELTSASMRPLINEIINITKNLTTNLNILQKIKAKNSDYKQLIQLVYQKKLE